MIPHSAQTTEGFIPTETNASLINMIKKKKKSILKQTVIEGKKKTTCKC